MSNNVVNLCEFMPFRQNHDRVFEFLKMDVGFETLFLSFFWSGEELEKDTFYIRFKYYSEVSCRFTLI